MKEIAFKFIGPLLLVLTIFSCGEEQIEILNDYTDEEYDIISKRLNLPSNALEYSSFIDGDIFISEAQEQDFKSRSFNHKATLGRVLFYDHKLSINESVSCASCHKQALAFADDVAFSEGFNGEVTTRNSLPLGVTIGFTTAYGSKKSAKSLFSWDESNDAISSQTEAAILSSIEMGLDMETLVDRIQKDDIYPILFRKAYGEGEIKENLVLDAIERFVNSIVSSDSKFDRVMIWNDGNVSAHFNGFTEAENLGKDIYMKNCSSCHSKDHKLSAMATANNGLDLVYEDKGVGARTRNSKENGVFKVPFLRNVELTAPYMHDGRFETIREVINHYSEGISNHPNLNSNLKDGDEPIRMNFTEDEKVALEAYLLTLTGKKIFTDVRFSDPFK